MNYFSMAFVIPRFLFLSLLILLVLTITPSAANAQTGFSRLVIFGDSLSDTGNIESVTINLPFPYYQGRISNGPVLVDYLADKIASSSAPSLHLIGNAVGYNYAVGGGNIVGTDPEDLSSQVSAYLARHGGRADPQALYLVMLGGNDLRGVRSEPNSTVAMAQIEQILNGLQSQLSRLIDAGGTTFMVPNIPNIGRLPQTIEREFEDPGIAARAKTYSQIYNSRLAQLLDSIAVDKSIGITPFDLYSELEGLFVNPAALGFRQTEVGCFELSGFSFHPDCDFGTRFDRFVFFDSLHPTAKTNRLISDRFVDAAPRSPFQLQKSMPVVPLMLLLDDD